MPMKMPGWFKPVTYMTGGPLHAAETVVSRFVCGVKDCLDGLIAQSDELETVVECDTHNARTTYDTVEREVRQQQVIRVQDQWRQHGTQPPPGRR